MPPLVGTIHTCKSRYVPEHFVEMDTLMLFLSHVKGIVLRMDWNSGATISRLSQSILFVAGSQDELVPHSHTEALHSLATTSKRVVRPPVPNRTHNDSRLRGGDNLYFAVLRQFLASLNNGAVDETCTADADGLSRVSEGTIPTMVQQPIMGSVTKTDKPHSDALQVNIRNDLSFAACRHCAEPSCRKNNWSIAQQPHRYQYEETNR